MKKTLFLMVGIIFLIVASFAGAEVRISTYPGSRSSASVFYVDPQFGPAVAIGHSGATIHIRGPNNNVLMEPSTVGSGIWALGLDTRSDEDGAINGFVIDGPGNSTSSVLYYSTLMGLRDPLITPYDDGTYGAVGIANSYLYAVKTFYTHRPGHSSRRPTMIRVFGEISGVPVVIDYGMDGVHLATHTIGASGEIRDGLQTFDSAGVNSGMVIAGQINSGPYIGRYDLANQETASWTWPAGPGFSSVIQDGTGAVYAVTSENSRVSVYKFSLSMVQTWNRQVQIQSRITYGQDIALSGNGQSILATGYNMWSVGSAQYGDAFILPISLSGTVGAPLVIDESIRDAGLTISVFPTGQVIVGGKITDAQGADQMMVAWTDDFMSATPTPTPTPTATPTPTPTATPTPTPTPTATPTPIPTRYITATSGLGGTVSPVGTTAVVSGGSQAYVIAPNTGYHITDVQVDGASVGIRTSYVFNNVVVNHTISASFALNTYTITATAGQNGTINPSGPRTVNYGDSLIIAITPNAGFLVGNVLVDGASVGALMSYTFTSVNANHTISATFVPEPTPPPNSYAIVATCGNNGAISPLGTSTVTSGGSQTYTITPDDGFVIASVTVNGASVGAVSSYTFSNVRANGTINATFVAEDEPCTLAIIYTGDGTGKVTTEPAITAQSCFAPGTKINITIDPDPGSILTEWFLTGPSVNDWSDTEDFFQVTIQENLTLEVNFGKEAAPTPTPDPTPPPSGGGGGGGCFISSLVH